MNSPSWFSTEQGSRGSSLSLVLARSVSVCSLAHHACAQGFVMSGPYRPRECGRYALEENSIENMDSVSPLGAESPRKASAESLSRDKETITRLPGRSRSNAKFVC